MGDDKRMQIDAEAMKAIQNLNREYLEIINDPDCSLSAKELKALQRDFDHDRAKVMSNRLRALRELDLGN